MESLQIFPERDSSSSPGLLYSATLGKRAASSATPSGLRRSSLLFPKVAEYSNLGLWAATTTWLTTSSVAALQANIRGIDLFGRSARSYF